MTQKLLKLFFMFFVLGTISMQAQTTLVSGTVTDALDLTTLPGVNVVIKGTTTGTTTDFDGRYTIEVSDPNGILQFSFLGYTTQEVSVNGNKSIDIAMVGGNEALDEVVVTALGIKKEAKALGYSITQVDGDELSVIPTTSAINSLQGKVAGVNITQNATGASGSTRVIIRGASSLTGNNQPLYVVDGIPITNQTNGSAGMWGGSDGGDGISSMNPDNIESMSVLKGGSATALYGSRASNGVIIITTKTGKTQHGFGVEINSAFTVDKVNTGLYNYQTEYGQGQFGEKPANQEAALDQSFSSWGALLDGSSVPQWDGESRPYSYVGNNAEKFYDTGFTSNNTVAISDANETMNYRFSYSNLYNEDIMPNAGLTRNTFAINAGAKLADKLTSNVSAQYIWEKVDNRARLSDAPGNANYSAGLLPPNVNVNFMEPGNNEDGTERRISSGSFTQNPYWSAYNFSNDDLSNRFIGSFNLRYDILEWLYISGRAGIDYKNISRTRVTPWGTAYQPLGSMNVWNIAATQVDADVIFGVNRELVDRLNISAFIGANSNRIRNETLQVGGSQFIVPGLEDVGNLATQTRSRTFSERALSSVYGSIELAWDGWAYLTWTGRNDWFSTLSFPGKVEPNDDFYQSLSASVILSEAFEMGDAVNFLKVRGGYSEVAGGADEAYQLALTYEIFGNGFLGQPLGRINGSQIPNSVLVPSGKTEWEFGFDGRFLANRINFDIAVYGNQTKNDIVGVGASLASGYGSALQNISIIENTGVEILVGGIPVQTDSFEWNSSLNYTYNSSKIVETDDVDSEISLGTARSRNVQIKQVVGEPFGTIVGTTYTRDENGTIMYDYDPADPTSIPRAITGGQEILGVGVPPVIWGWSNTFTLKNWTLFFLIDGKNGAQIYSGTNMNLTGNGLHKQTLEGRVDGLPVSGIDSNGNPFSTTVEPADLAIYYGRETGIAERWVEDANFVKFRQLSFGYTFDSKYMDKTFLESVGISFIASNLFYISRSIENIDPEAAYTNNNAQGLEWFGLPSTRSYGLNFNIKF
jgi:TonB-linked SusC/RagA family outer membrane protein